MRARLRRRAVVAQVGEQLFEQAPRKPLRADNFDALCRAVVGERPLFLPDERDAALFDGIPVRLLRGKDVVRAHTAFGEPRLHGIRPRVGAVPAADRIGERAEHGIFVRRHDVPERLCRRALRFAVIGKGAAAPARDGDRARQDGIALLRAAFDREVALRAERGGHRIFPCIRLRARAGKIVQKFREQAARKPRAADNFDALRRTVVGKFRRRLPDERCAAPFDGILVRLFRIKGVVRRVGQLRLHSMRARVPAAARRDRIAEQRERFRLLSRNDVPERRRVRVLHASVVGERAAFPNGDRDLPLPDRKGVLGVFQGIVPVFDGGVRGIVARVRFPARYGEAEIPVFSDALCRRRGKMFLPVVGEGRRAPLHFGFIRLYGERAGGVPRSDRVFLRRVARERQGDRVVARVAHGIAAERIGQLVAADRLPRRRFAHDGFVRRSVCKVRRERPGKFKLFFGDLQLCECGRLRRERGDRIRREGDRNAVRSALRRRRHAELALRAAARVPVGRRPAERNVHALHGRADHRSERDFRAVHDGEAVLRRNAYGRGFQRPDGIDGDAVLAFAKNGRSVAERQTAAAALRVLPRDGKAVARGQFVQKVLHGARHGIAVAERLPADGGLLVVLCRFVQIVVVLADIHGVHPLEPDRDRGAFGKRLPEQRGERIVGGVAEDPAAELRIPPMQVLVRRLVGVRKVRVLRLVRAQVEGLPLPAVPGGQDIPLRDRVRLHRVGEGDTDLALLQPEGAEAVGDAQRVFGHGGAFGKFVEQHAQFVDVLPVRIDGQVVRHIRKGARIVEHEVAVPLEADDGDALRGEHAAVERADGLPVKALGHDDRIAAAFQHARHLVIPFFLVVRIGQRAQPAAEPLPEKAVSEQERGVKAGRRQKQRRKHRRDGAARERAQFCRVQRGKQHRREHQRMHRDPGDLRRFRDDGNARLHVQKDREHGHRKGDGEIQRDPQHRIAETEIREDGAQQEQHVRRQKNGRADKIHARKTARAEHRQHKNICNGGKRRAREQDALAACDALRRQRRSVYTFAHTSSLHIRLARLCDVPVRADRKFVKDVPVLA